MSTYEPIASQTLGSAAASVTFSSIPQGYTDLRLVMSGSMSAGADVTLQFNSDTATNYSRTYLIGSGSAAGTGRTTSNAEMPVFYIGATSTYSAFADINNYSNSTTFKTVLCRSGDTGSYVEANVGLWRNTAAITSMKIIATGGVTFSSGSTFSIYGIQVGQAAQKAQGGNIVTSDGTYMYHAFTSSGSFIPNEALTADLLLVAGGGGAGFGGAGGAGGMKTFTSQSFTPKTYAIIVGGGGAGTTSSMGGAQRGTKGTNTSVSVLALSASGGGRGGGNPKTSDNDGGSGGSVNPNVDGNGTGISGEGNNAGTTSRSAPNYASGGGGGKNAAGGNGTSTTGGNGGAGLNTAISGGSTTGVGQLVSGTYYFAGGGGGGTYGGGTAGTGGNGGGGNGSSTGNGTSALVNTGGGGGGGAQSPGTGDDYRAGGAGGSGIVVIRYAI